jgi:chemotaxis protein CheZ
MSTTNDSDDLEALFDSIAADFTPAPAAPVAVAPAPGARTGRRASKQRDATGRQ